MANFKRRRRRDPVNHVKDKAGKTRTIDERAERARSDWRGSPKGDRANVLPVNTRRRMSDEDEWAEASEEEKRVLLEGEVSSLLGAWGPMRLEELMRLLAGSPDPIFIRAAVSEMLEEETLVLSAGEVSLPD